MTFFLWEVGLSSGPIREAVLLKGVLKGMNHEVPCTVRAV